MNIPSIFWLVPAASVVALGFAYAFYRKMKRQSEGTERMREIAGHVRAGAMAYLRQQYKVVTRQQVAHIDRDRTAHAQDVETHDRDHRVDPGEHIRLPPEQ